MRPQMPVATPSPSSSGLECPRARQRLRGTTIPPGVALEDGLTQDEAVAIALWNNPEFQVQLANLGFARADLVEAGLLQNPVLSLLFPWGPKQLEATLRWPVELLWQRPRRVAAAQKAAESVAAGLEQDGLTLVSDVKLAYAEFGLAQDRVALAERALAELNAIAMLMDSRFQAGDISQLEARVASIDAARARQDVERARLDAVLRANELRARLGLALEPAPTPPRLTPAPLVPCAVTATVLTDALASRPDVRAAELAVEAAGSRLGWERSRVLTFTAVLDANGEGQKASNWAPGIDIGHPALQPQPRRHYPRAGRAPTRERPVSRRASARRDRGSGGRGAIRPGVGGRGGVAQDSPGAAGRAGRRRRPCLQRGRGRLSLRHRDEPPAD